MKLPTLVIRNLRRRPLATTLTVFSVALGVGLFTAIGSLRQSAERGFLRSARICDMVVGPKGSSLQLILNSLYHMDRSPGNMPFAAYRELAQARGVEWAVPTTVGDSYRGSRIIGVTDAMFGEMALPDFGPLRFAQGTGFEFSFEQLVALHAEMEAHFLEDPEQDHSGHGHHHELFHPEWYVAVVGSQAARRTDLKVGDRFRPVHDVKSSAGAEVHEEAEMKVVGVLEATGTPLDHGIYIPIGAFYGIDGHQPKDAINQGGARDPLGVSSVWVRTRSTAAFYRLRIFNDFNNRLDTQAVWPRDEVNKLFAVVGNVNQILRVVAALVVVVALVGVLVAIYNTMGARRREFAILRALGARRRTVLALVVCESGAIALVGGLLGMVFAAAGVLLAAGTLNDMTGVAIALPVPGWQEGQVLLLVTLVGALAGLIPAMSAYRTEAAKHLSRSA